MEHIIEILVLVSSVFLKIVGMPDQVRKLYKSKDSNGFSTIYYVSLLVTYLLWIIHGSYKSDWVVISTSIIGAIATSIIVFLIIKYKNKMKNLILIFILFTTLPCLSQTNDFEVVNLFFQGKANNCASVALIKAAMSKYGYNNIFQVTKNDTKYLIKLKDNTELSISKNEYDLAKKNSKFEINETQLSETEKVEVLFYAYLSYAVIAKYIEEYGFWGCIDSNGNSLHFRKTKNYVESLNYITRTSICTDNCYRLLGLKIKDGQVKNYSGTENLDGKGIVLYSWQHAVATYNGKLDCHGTWLNIGTQKICENNFEFYIELE